MIQWDLIVILWDFIVIQWDSIVIQWDMNWMYPMVITNIAIETGHRNTKFSR